MSDLQTRERQPTRVRTVEPEAHVDEPAAPHLLTGLLGLGGLFVLLGLFAVSGAGAVHGAWWALYAIPAAMLVAAAWLAAATFGRRLSAPR